MPTNGRGAKLDRFGSSAEGRSLGVAVGWYRTFTELAQRYSGKDPRDMEPADVEDVLFREFPREVLCLPAEARTIVLELRAFFRFLKRGYAPKHADACIAFLNHRTVRRLERLLDDPTRFGTVKLFFSMNGPNPTADQNHWKFTASGGYPTTADGFCWHLRPRR
jgi:hypothetical protein